jgi:hypothetical protein
MELFVAGDTDAFLGFPTEPQELRARGFNRVILSTITDRPWSQYFCCLIHGNRAWVRDHRSRPSVFCARSSKPPSSAKPTRRTRRAGSWMAGSRRSTTTRSRRSKSSPCALCAAPARGGHPAHQPERATRGGRRLAFRQRAQGVSRVAKRMSARDAVDGFPPGSSVSCDG